jgi:hypothetical protein
MARERHPRFCLCVRPRSELLPPTLKRGRAATNFGGLVRIAKGALSYSRGTDPVAKAFEWAAQPYFTR